MRELGQTSSSENSQDNV